MSSVTVPIPNTKTKTKLVVKSKEKYPTKMDKTLEIIFLKNLKLKIIDRRLIPIEHLKVLDLSNNLIKSIEPLKNLNGVLEKLVLDDNPIKFLHDDFFLAPGLASLNNLSLQNTGLNHVPRSIIKLKKLRALNLARNKLKKLPYNIGNMTSLNTLELRRNQLKFLPFTIYHLRLAYLDIADNEFLPDTQPTFCWSRQVPQYNGTMVGRGVPPLMVLAAEKLANHRHFRRSYYSATTSSKIYEILNKDCIELLENLHICTDCNNLSFNFVLWYETTPATPAGSIVRDRHQGNRYDTTRVRCSKCMRRRP